MRLSAPQPIFAPTSSSPHVVDEISLIFSFSIFSFVFWCLPSHLLSSLGSSRVVFGPSWLPVTDELSFTSVTTKSKWPQMQHVWTGSLSVLEVEAVLKINEEELVYLRVEYYSVFTRWEVGLHVVFISETMWKDCGNNKWRIKPAAWEAQTQNSDLSPAKKNK